MPGLRAIYPWKKIPYRVKHLDVSYIAKDKLVDWLARNIFKYTRLFQTERDWEYLYAVICNSNSDPDGIVKLLNNKIGERTWCRFVMLTI
jgi:hypothetical protein